MQDTAAAKRFGRKFGYAVQELPMLSTVRAFSKTIFAKLLLGLLVIGMAIFGMQGVLQARFSNDVVAAGDRAITPAQFKKMFDAERQRRQQQAGQEISVDQLTDAGVHQQMLQALANQESYLAWMDRIHLRADDSLIVERLRQMPIFFNPVTGAFDENEFVQILAREGLDKKTFDQGMHDDIINSHFNSGMVAGLRLPRIYGSLMAAYGLERRDASWITVTPQSIPQPPVPTDAQLRAFMTENRAQIERPELRELTVVLFTPAAFASSVQLDEALLRRTYEFRKAALSQAERRTFVQIAVKDAATGQRVIAALRAGQDPQAVARAAGAQAVPYQDRPRTAVPDRSVAAQAFTLAPGQVSGLIRGELGGASVIKVLGVSPGREIIFEEARKDLETELRREAATEKTYEVVQQFERLREGGMPMLDAARQVGARVVEDLAPVSEEGIAINGQRINAPPVLFQSAFALPAGGESDAAEDAGNGQYFAVKVRKVIPAGLPPLEENKPGMTRAYMQREVVRRMEAKAQELAGRLRKGESLAVVAASAGLQPQTGKDIARAQNPQLGQGMVAEIFGRKPGDVFVTRMPQGFAVGKLDAVHSPPSAPAARMAEQARPQISGEYVSQMVELLRTAARDIIKPKTYPDRANVAVGLQPDAGAPAAAKDSGKKK